MKPLEPDDLSFGIPKKSKLDKKEMDSKEYRMGYQAAMTSVLQQKLAGEQQQLAADKAALSEGVQKLVQMVAQVEQQLAGPPMSGPMSPEQYGGDPFGNALPGMAPVSGGGGSLPEGMMSQGIMPPGGMPPQGGPQGMPQGMPMM